MKLKLLIAPIVVILVVVFAAAFILPKVLETKDSFDGFKKSEQGLAIVSEKVEKAKKLGQELTTNAEKQNILLRYIPSSKQEEEIINNINAVAVSDGLAVINITPVAKLEGASSGPSENVNVGEDVLSGDKAAEAGRAVAQSANAIKMVNAGVDVAGNYDQIKSFLEKISKMQRVVQVLSLEISRVANSENADPNRLQANLILGFGYLEKVNIANVNSEILNSGRFNMSVIDKIKNNAKTDFSSIEVGQMGKNNPFIP